MLHAGQSPRRGDMARRLDQALKKRRAPESITVDNRSEFCSQVIDTWNYYNFVLLDLIRRGKPVENHYIESSNGRLRDEYLSRNPFSNLEDGPREA